MDASHTDIGFETNKKQWFAEFKDKMRWISGYSMIKYEGTLFLKDVLFDTYQWNDPVNHDNSHGRMRVFGKPTRTSKGNEDVLDELIFIGTGDNTTIKFEEVKADNIEIKYNLKDMTWTILADGRTFVTKDITGIISGNFTTNPIRFKSINCVFLHSWLITLFNLNLIIGDKNGS